MTQDVKDATAIKKIDDLPIEILDKIFDKFAFDDLSRVVQACKVFQAVVQGNQRLTRRKDSVASSNRVHKLARRNRTVHGRRILGPSLGAETPLQRRVVSRLGLG